MRKSKFLLGVYFLITIFSTISIAQIKGTQVVADDSYLIVDGNKIELVESYYPPDKWTLHNLAVLNKGYYSPKKDEEDQYTLSFGLHTKEALGKKIEDEHIYHTWWHPNQAPVYTGDNPAISFSISIASYKKKALQNVQYWFAVEDEGIVEVNDAYQIDKNIIKQGKLVLFKNLRLKYVDLDDHSDDSTYKAPVYPEKLISGKLFLPGSENEIPIAKSKLTRFCDQYDLQDYYSGQEPNYHEYKLDKEICKKKDNPYCTVDNVFKHMVSNLNYAAPGNIDALLNPDFNLTFIAGKPILPAGYDQEILKRRNEGNHICDCMVTNLFGFGDPSNGTRDMYETLKRVLSPEAYSGLIYEKNASPIVNSVYPEKHMVVNRTLPSHFLYPGKVTRTILELDGKVIVRTIGVGTTAKSTLNKEVGLYLFDRINYNLWFDFNVIASLPRLQNLVKDVPCKTSATLKSVDYNYLKWKNNEIILEPEKYISYPNSIGIQQSGVIIRNKKYDFDGADLSILFYANINTKPLIEVESFQPHQWPYPTPIGYSEEMKEPWVDISLSYGKEKPYVNWINVKNEGTVTVKNASRNINGKRVDGKLISFEDIIMVPDPNNTPRELRETISSIPKQTISGMVFCILKK
ncbi:hypothetical protein [Spirosoma radiotolerans]|uniref:Uncharacterized protein n=1 Tax=Spirosoma radiotolerans TaxID=1379870 RepID=A0A0E3ZTT3_9BACT|nr:hypothetical protein [Spirosoma radiotolerans]AKD54024.1 hypothetical protein SD10_03010 [Spirosoma radiotolerans]